MSDSTEKTTIYRIFDKRLDSYQSFWDVSWGKKFIALTRSSDIEIPALDLGSTWKGTANVRSLPYHMIQSLESTYNVVTKDRVPMPILSIERVMHTLVQETELELTHRQLIGIIGYFLAKTKPIKEEFKKTSPYKYDKQMAWEAMCTLKDFQLGLYQSEVNSYSSLYFAYEDFLRRTCESILNRQISTMNASVIREAFDENIFNKCWNDTKVNHARLVRTAIAHNGCKETDALKKVTPKHGFKLHPDGGIVIMCEHVTDLYNVLKEKVLLICGHERVKSTIKH